MIGARVPRLEDQALLTGGGRFVDDIACPGVLHAAFVRSPHPHALIRSLDASAARAVPGVAAVLTLDDLAPVMKQRRMIRTSNSGTKLDQSWRFALADGEVSFVGEPVAIVLADDRYAAEDAAALVVVDYDMLPAATDCRNAERRRRCAASSPRTRSSPTRSPMATSTQRSPRPRMSCTRICGSIAAPRIRWKAAASWRKSPIARPRCGLRRRRRTICAPRLPIISISTKAGCAWRRPMSAAASGRSFASIRRTSRWSPQRRCCAARSNGSRTAASISPMRRRSATNIGRSSSPRMPMGACAACAAASSTTSAPMRCRT